MQVRAGGVEWMALDGPVGTASPVRRRAAARRPAAAPGRHELDSWTSRRGFLQARLEVGRADDPLEHEAERVAAQVVGFPFDTPGTSWAAPTTVRRACSCDVDGAADAPPVVGEALRSPGSPLDPGVRDFFESRFGHDFSDVRVHTGTRAAESAHAIQAQAYTVGRDIVVPPERYRPYDDDGRRLLAHELTHVIQQRSAAGSVGRAGSVRRQLFPPVPIVVAPATSVEVNAVDARQARGISWYKPWRYTGPITSFFRGDVTMTDVASMATNVLAYLRGRSMDRLNVMDHGNAAGVEIGDDWIATPAHVAAHSANLGRLRGRFTGSGFVHMQNCNAGQNRGVICALAAAFGVPVYAGTGAQNPVLGFNVGDYVRCEPNGTFNPDSGRPSTPSHRMPGTLFGEPEPIQA